jgi:hypothetical protein
MGQRQVTANIEYHDGFWNRAYKPVSLTLAVVFAVVGAVFLLIPSHVLSFFNTISINFGLPATATEGTSFFLILAAAYMYLVAMLAFMMYRHTESSSFPFLLINAKLASSVVSVLFVIVHGSCLIYVVNAITDGSIALGVFVLHRMTHERSS